MREAFARTLTNIAQRDKNLWLLTGDLGFSVWENFIEKFPKQYLNMGVSEQNMIGTACGLALSGKTVFVYSIIPFITLRPLEQVRNDICMQNANVKLIGIGSGFSYGQLGPTHHSIEDICVMRSLPNITIACPGDPWEAQEATKAIYKLKGPAYLRLGKKGEPRLHVKGVKFTLGRGIVVRDGADLTVVACGSMLETAIEVADRLNAKNIGATVISMHTIKPLDKNLILETAKRTGAIFTLEEHSMIGGLGSAVSEVIAESGISLKFQSFGVRDKFTKIAGTQRYLRGINGLSPDEITKSILKKISD